MAFCEGFEVRKVAGCNYIVDLRCEKDYINPMFINDIASEMFELFKKGKDIKEVAEEISFKYEVSFETVLRDCGIFIGELENNGIYRK